ncbi:uncharacterized protein M421DRAFT_415473 [Didymella exigua CBS 183.55]|uniref:Uncharacterized protein n=1 Tax=Didymella exigua CBS 183.55 TaxID=1150837 RepID=A0A6A5S509_9PLEO|nr:uncharacterized protein M421DRAFT_415473 [Didymella exigua CBS 183.55]KAF1934448.1 hypothetical protein M421DRAFT_415473 [Didymella exigua CBS 183.55]
MFTWSKKKRQGTSRPVSRDPTYDPLLASEEEQDYENKTPGESQRFMTWAAVLGILVLCTAGASLITVGTSSLQPYAYERYDPRIKRCGETAQEATTRGCEFDPITFSWLPPDCVDHGLIDEFRATGWTLYAGRNTTATLIEEDWAMGIDEKRHAWLTRKDYILHCVFVWKIMHRAIALGRSLPTVVSSYAETELCGRILEEHESANDIAYKVAVQFPAC